MSWVHNTDYWGTWVWDAGLYLGPFGVSVTLGPPSLPLPSGTGEVWLSVAPTPESKGRTPQNYSYVNGLTSYADAAGLVEGDTGPATDGDHLYVIWFDEGYTQNHPEPTFDATSLYTAEQAAGGTGGGGVAPVPESTNTSIQHHAYQTHTVILTPNDPNMVEARSYKLSAGGVLWWQYIVDVNRGSVDGSEPASRAGGVSTITATGGATIELWPRPMYYLGTSAEIDALDDGPPSHGPAESISLNTPYDPTAWVVKVTLPPGEGIITFTGPDLIPGDYRYTYFSEWHTQSRYDATDPSDPYFGQTGIAAYDVGESRQYIPPNPVTSWRTKRTIVLDYYNGPEYNQDFVEGPVVNPHQRPLLLQYSYAHVSGVTDQWLEDQAGWHLCSKPVLDWWDINGQTDGVRGLFTPYPLANGTTPYDFAAALPQDGTEIPEPWVPAATGWGVEWDYSTYELLDTLRWRITEVGETGHAELEGIINYHRNITKGGNASVETTYVTHGEQNAIKYSESHPGPVLEAGRVTDILGSYADVDNSQVSFAPNRHGKVFEYDYPNGMLIGQSIGHDMTATWRIHTWVRVPRYRYYRLYVRPGAEDTPPMRQRHRNDGLATDAREFKGYGSSQQISIRRGGRTYY